jgi:hypothetical protein
MSDKPRKKSTGMIGVPPSARGGRPAHPGLHANQLAQEWEDVVEGYLRRRMQELGIPDALIGEPTYGGDGRWRAFNPQGRQGGTNTTGVVVDSGVLNPKLLEGQKGGRIWPKLRLKDRIDAIIAHEYEELRSGGHHTLALKAAARTELPISAKARRFNRARAR